MVWSLGLKVLNCNSKPEQNLVFCGVAQRPCLGQRGYGFTVLGLSAFYEPARVPKVLSPKILLVPFIGYILWLLFAGT